MNTQTRRLLVQGPAGALECAIDDPHGEAARGVAVLCHPHPQFGGTMDNKVVQTLARAALQTGWRAVRFNFRGVGTSAGSWDEGRGEVDDALAVVAQLCPADTPLLLGGFSFGGYVASQVGHRLSEAGTAPAKMLLVAPAVVNFPMAPLPAGSWVFHGESDDVVPLTAVLDWARHPTQAVTVVPGCGHFFHGQLTLLKQLLVCACR